MKPFLKILLPASVVAVGLAAGAFLLGGPRSTVAWGPLRAVAIESDDWGLAGFVPDAQAWRDLDRQRLKTVFFPEVYWLSTLEDSAMVADLNRVLASHTGRDGHPAVLQPNYIMSSLAHAAGRWERFDLPDLPFHYLRPGLWRAVEAGIGQGTWYPEFHGTWHYDPQRRMQTALEDDFTRQVTGRGIMLFPGSESARELGAWRSGEDLGRELDHSLAVFRNLFGRSPGAVIAPDYHWDDRAENIWADRGLRVIQGKREQVNPAWGSGTRGRLWKYVMRHWARLRHPGRIYLERNCRLEPVQSPDPDPVVRDCAAQTRGAWAAGQPAIVESHRVNFAHTDDALAAAGRRALDRYLADIAADSVAGPVFLTDHEIAQLYARGTSWCVRGGVVVVRNATCGTKVIFIPTRALAQAAASGGKTVPATAPALVKVAPGETFDLVP